MKTLTIRVPMPSSEMGWFLTGISAACLFAVIVACDNNSARYTAPEKRPPTNLAGAEKASNEIAAALLKDGPQLESSAKHIDATFNAAPDFPKIAPDLTTIHSIATDLNLNGNRLNDTATGLKADQLSIAATEKERDEAVKAAAAAQKRADEAEARADSAAHRWFVALAALGGVGLAASIGLGVLAIVNGKSPIGACIAAGVCIIFTGTMTGLSIWGREIAIGSMVALGVALIGGVAYVVVVAVKKAREAKVKTTALDQVVATVDASKKAIKELAPEAAPKILSTLFATPQDGSTPGIAYHIQSDATESQVMQAQARNAAITGADTKATA